MKLLGISGTIIGSKTVVAVKSVLEYIKMHYPDIDMELLDLKHYDLQFCDGRNPTAYTGDTRKVIDKICNTDFFVIGTPIFQASIPGPLKNLFDLVPVSAFYNKVMGFVATGGTYQHYLVIENQLKPIAGYFRAYVAPSYVYIQAEHYDDNNNIIDPIIHERLEKLAKEVVWMQKKLKGSVVENHGEDR